MSKPTSNLPPSTSLSTDRSTAATELAPLIEELKATCDNCDKQTFASQQFHTVTESLLRLRHTFLDNDSPREAQEAFRHLDGFETLLQLVKKLSHLYEPTELSAEERRSLLTIYKDALAVLAESLEGNFGNRRYFARRISGGGTAALQEALDIIVPKFSGAQGDTEQFYGGILAAALCQEAVADIFTTLNAKFQSVEELLQQDVKAEVDRRMGSSETVEVPELLGPFLKGWLKQSGSSPSDYRVQRLVLPACLCQLAHQSQRNLTALHATGILSSILPILFGCDRLESERIIYQDLAELLCAQGLTSLEDAATLYRQAHGCARMLRFLVDVLKCSKGPPLIQFDMSLHGYSSLEFSTLGRPFPPVTSSGYTIAVWARFDRFDPSTHTTIFGAFDASQSCFLLAYLERDTRNFILQTSIRGTRPSVRFKSMAFEPNRWYHICVVHKKPRPPSHSRASLFIDGEFVEQLRIDYPCLPVSNTPNRLPRVQAFFGTPQDLAMKLGKAVSVSRWSLANAILFEEAHSDDMVSVFYNLGPRYFGNFQDCLGSFQTYKASATLNLRNEHLHPGKEEASDIVTAIRRKASVLIREGSILINISPMSVLDDDDNNNIDESQLIKSLSRKAIKNLHLLTKAGGNAVAANGAIPSLNDALTQAHGMGVLTGDPVVSVPHSLDDVSWRIGGCAAVHLSLVHAAKTAECLTLAVEALYEAVQDNWRNSEAMERENGYGILAAILRDKFGLGNSSATSRASSICSNLEKRYALGLDLLRLTLKFVGYDFQHPNRSIITNPLAYRVLLVDLDIWRLGDSAQLSLYYSQFSTFAGESNYRRFNAKRLSRMRVNKRLLEALKGDDFTSESLSLLVSAFRSLMESCLSADLFRSLALFITYAIHKTREPSRLQKKKSLRFTAGSPQIAASAERGDCVSSTKIAVEMLRMYASVVCDSHDLTPLKKFARSVTNKWLLYLICEDEPEIVALATKILARLIVSHGDVYSKKFSEKTGGYIIMRHRLRSWWKVPAIWCICLSILFGVDVGDMRLDQPFNRPGLIEILSSNGQPRVAFPEMLPVLMEMMQLGLQSVTSADELSSSGVHGTKSLRESPVRLESPPTSLTTRVTELTKQISILDAVVGLFADLHQKSADFRDFAAQSDYVQWLLYVAFPVVVGSNISSTDFELKSHAAKNNSHDHILPVRPRSSGTAGLHTTTVEGSSSRDRQAGPLRRGSSFILVSSDRTKFSPSLARIHKAFIPLGSPPDMTATDHPLVQAILSLVLSVFCDQLLERKDFAGLGLYLKTPTSSLEQQAYFNSWILRSLLSRLRDVTISKPQVLLEPRALSNMGRFATHIGEAVYEGWFIDGATHALEFAGAVLEYLQQSNVSSLKSVRLCSQAVKTIRSTLFRVVLLKLSEVDDREACEFLNRLSYWQVVLFSEGEVQSDYLRLLCYLLYTKLISQDWDIRLAAAGLWRVILVQKPAEMSAILSQAAIPLQKRLSDGFEVLVGMDDKAFLQWVDGHQDDLNAMFLGLLSRSWENFVQEESSNIDSSTRARASKRQEKLRHWNQLERLSEEVTRKHETTFPHWVSNISASEFLKYQRALQDQQDNSVFMWTAFSHMTMDLKRFGGVLQENKDRKWRLDQTEGRSRMRLRMVPDESGERQDYQPKRKASEPPAIKIDTQVQTSPNGNTTGLTPTVLAAENMDDNQQDAHSDSRSVLEESFEMIDDPKADLEDYEDKNRKVMRSLHRGDQVENVCNMSRIIGLEACEGLLILGKDHIYILDNFFQRSDGEIVNVWQAPTDERDPYVRMIAGRESFERRSQEHETRSWKWSDLVSVSKRRFLFRDVALEVFFTDGTSYLLTLISSRARDNLCSQLASKAPQVTGSAGHSRPEDVWRFETLRSQEDAPQSLGSKFASVFGHSPVHPATRKWIKGEISNFHYLMLINTLAGRTFNDLTQYPVFPWVLADYTSEELDLTDPKAFRDLSKPMGCQTLEREAEFRERYKAFAEMGDGDAPPFHYGTHYSSAMIVCSYLIRLQPFVKSYLLLQGGTFDHADRLFYSIRKAWESASRGNMSDVRELTPEFFYLPEFLVNSNKYDFGLLQNMTTAIDSVELPPWAKGDPKIFIAKHREALESPYVTENLHHWIDLVFGCKQKGEAAIEAVNVFHHLSYQGAKDIDNIDDPVERLATIGIIHNFGQTPHQIFTRPHPPREDTRHKVPRLDRLAESLTQLPLSLLDIGEQVSTLSMKHDRLLCAAPLRLNIPPNYDKYMEWGFFDGSVRFYSADSRKILGHFEHLHIGQLSCTIFADSRTLVTSGTDCVVSIWTYNSTAKSVDLQPAGSLFGHRTPVNVLAVSRSFSALLSASTDGQIMLWDLNQHTFVRELPASGPVDCARINDVTGEIMVCRGNRISIYTLNGALLLEQDVCESIDDRVMSCVFYEGVDNEWQERELIFTGHRKGVVNIWNKTIRDGRFELELIRQLHHIDNNRDNGANISAGISCILTLPHVVYTGDEAGRVYEWNCVQRR